MDNLLRLDYITQASVKGLIEKIDKYDRNWKRRDQLDPDQLRSLRKLAAIQSIGSSTRIEGSSLSDEEVARLIDNMDITKLVSRDQQEVAGYYRVLDIPQDQYAELTLSETLIKGLHHELMRFSQKDQHHRGDYKKQSNRVVATDELLPEVSRSTVKNDLSQLTKAGYLKRHSKGRGTVYTRK